ncbi:MAG: porin [Deltaproteobacteria bacterium]|nr:porin [Deltaproteobacteria bacterium]
MSKKKGFCKRLVFEPIVVLIVILFLAHPKVLADTGDPAMDTLIKKMEEKGLITKDEIEKIKEDVRKAVSERNKRITKDLKLPFDLRVRLQPRFEYGDLLIDDNKRYTEESDLYMRRLRVSFLKEFEKPPFGNKVWASITFDADRLEMDLDKGARKDPDRKVNVNTVELGWLFADQFGIYLGYDVPPSYRNTSSGKHLIIDGPTALMSASDKLTGGPQVHVRLFGQLGNGVFKYTLAYGDGPNSLSKLKDIDSDATKLNNKEWGDLLSARIEFAPPGLVEKGWDDTNMGKENFLSIGLGGAITGKKRYQAGTSKPDVHVRLSTFNLDLSGRYRWGEISFTSSAGYMRFKKNFSYKEDESPRGYYIQAGILLPGKVFSGQIEPVAKYDLCDTDKAGKRKTKEKTFALGFNHYISKHNLKWGYNYVQTKYERDVRVALNDSTRKVHQVQLQYEF